MQSNAPFPIKTLLHDSWQQTHGSKWPILAPLIVFVLIALGINGALSLIFSLLGLPLFSGGFTTGYTFTYVILAIIIQIITIFLTGPLVAGAQMVALKRVRAEAIDHKTGFKYWSKWLNLGLTIIIVTLGVGIINVIFGTLITLSFSVGYWLILIFQLLAVIAFIVFYAFFVFAVLFVADKGQDPIQAILSCYHLVRPHWLHISAVILCIGVGLLIVFLPMFLLSLAGYYLLLSLLGTAVTIALGVWAFPFFHLIVSGMFHKLADST